MAISYHNAECKFRFNSRRKTSRWLGACIIREGKHLGAINVIFCSDDYLLGINKQFLSHDYYTDVITFDYSQDGFISGDIYISVDTVARNASQFGQSPLREMNRVIVHGVLHLCGYGDKLPSEEKAMRAQEDLCLGILENGE